MTNVAITTLRTSDLRWIILKIHQLCNLNCSYCYVYNRGDDSWRSRPKQISDTVLHQVCHRIVEQCDRVKIKEFVVELHGGEPLLVGKKRLSNIINLMRDRCKDIDLQFLLQTNGTLIDLEWCTIFEENNISVGVSLDGPAELADKRRFFHNGRGTTELVLNKLKHIKKEIGLEFGILSVIDPKIRGSDMIDWFVANDIGSADFLLPLGNIANLPDQWEGVTAYKDFLLSAFDRWLLLDGKAPNIRLFEIMIRGHMGVRPQLDALGGDLGALCVVETNGAIGISDVIRICGGELARDKISIFDTAFHEHFYKSDVSAVQEPADMCQRCSEFAACGGGYVPHRYDGKRFSNP